jgi:hypothetical protein
MPRGRGTKKEDIEVNWDPKAVELSITGVISRPGSEDLVKTIASTSSGSVFGTSTTRTPSSNLAEIASPSTLGGLAEG